MSLVSGTTPVSNAVFFDFPQPDSCGFPRKEELIVSGFGYTVKDFTGGEEEWAFAVRDVEETARKKIGNVGFGLGVLLRRRCILPLKKALDSCVYISRSGCQALQELALRAFSEMRFRCLRLAVDPRHPKCTLGGVTYGGDVAERPDGLEEILTEESYRGTPPEVLEAVALAFQG